MGRTLTNSSPYSLFNGLDKDMRAFIRRCGTCAIRNADKHDMPECPIFMALYQSITDKTVRWEPEWVELQRGKPPVCIRYKDQAIKEEGGDEKT